MKIAIIGYGTVGQSLHRLINRNVKVGVLDPAPEFQEIREGDYSNPGYDLLLSTQDLLFYNPDIVFVCVPTPTVHGQHLADDVLQVAHDLRSYPGLLVIKSTVSVQIVEEIIRFRPTTVFWPEFLREDFAAQDMKFPSIIPIGAPSDAQFKYLESFIKEKTEIAWSRRIKSDHGYDSIQSHIVRCLPKEASYTKYAVNAFLAAKTVFFHQFQQWMNARGDGALYYDVVNILKQEPRMGTSHFDAPGRDGYGYAGTCFPKDVEALIESAFKDGLSLPLLEAVHTQNKELRTDK